MLALSKFLVVSMNKSEYMNSVIKLYRDDYTGSEHKRYDKLGFQNKNGLLGV